MRNRRLRILMTADPELPVPPTHYGGIERIIDMLIRQLIQRGHEIYLVAHRASTTPATLIPSRGQQSQSLRDTFHNAWQIRHILRRIGKVDLVHSFGRLAYLLPVMSSGIPKIQSYQRHISPRSVWLGRHLAHGQLTFTACSAYCANTVRDPGGHWVIIPNGVPLATYTFRPSVPAEAPLIFLGRLERIKGAHLAIEVAKRTGRSLLIAGPQTTGGPDDHYFSREIAPSCDGTAIRYVGPVDDQQKDDLLGRAAALLFPVEWDEPFGIVMVEALACGTPVIAFSRGAVPEIIEDGVTGFLCHSPNGMVGAVRRLETLNRARCRQVVEQRFSDRVVADAYEQLYFATCRMTDSGGHDRAVGR